MYYDWEAVYRYEAALYLQLFKQSANIRRQGAAFFMPKVLRSTHGLI